MGDNWITQQRAEEFGIEGQGPDESDRAFRMRVSGELRRRGYLIEAHEAYQNALFDTDDGVATGILGGVAQEMAGIDYHTSPEGAIGDDIASGKLVKSPPKDDSFLLLAIVLGM